MKCLKQLKSLNNSGCGVFLNSVGHEFLGVGVYEINLENCTLFIFEDGLSMLFPDREVCVKYDDILNIESHLSASVFSQVSKMQDVNVKLPLDINLSTGVVVLEVQLLFYSRILIVLIELWRMHKV